MNGTAVIVLLLVAAFVPAVIAERKGQGFWKWYVFGLLLWIVAVPMALMADDRRRSTP